VNDYFSDRENGPRARTEQVISPAVWAGLVATVQALINSGAFGLRFPERCPDGQAVCGCDTDALAASVIAEMPGLAWPLETMCRVEDGFLSQREPFAPDTLLIMDFIEFIYASVAKPIPGKYHDFFSHHHLTFDQQSGQEEFRSTVNRIFSRNGVAFEMLSTGRIVRVLPPVLGEDLKRKFFGLETGPSITCWMSVGQNSLTGILWYGARPWSACGMGGSGSNLLLTPATRRDLSRSFSMPPPQSHHSVHDWRKRPQN